MYIWSCIMIRKSTICLRGFTLFSDDLPISCFEEKSIKTMLPGVAFFNLINGIFRVFYKKFDLIILKIWSLLLFSQSVRELMGDWKEKSVNRPRREWVPSDKLLGQIMWIFFSLLIDLRKMSHLYLVTLSEHLSNWFDQDDV